MTWNLSVKQLRRGVSILLAACGFAGILGTVGWLALPTPTPAVTIKAVDVVEPHCSHLVSTALVAVDREIAGSFACLAENVQAGLAEGGYDMSDLGLHDFAVDQGRDHVRLIECTPAQTCVYRLSGKSVRTVFVFLFTDSSGLVYRVDGEALV